MTNPATLVATQTPRTIDSIMQFPIHAALTLYLLASQTQIRRLGSVPRTLQCLHLIRPPLSNVLLINILLVGSRNHIIQGLAP